MMNGKQKMIKFSEIFSCMKEEISCQLGLQYFLRLADIKLLTLPLVPVQSKGISNMDKVAGIFFELSIENGKIHEVGHHMRFPPANYNIYYFFFIVSFQHRLIGRSSDPFFKSHLLFIIITYHA